MRSLTNPVRPYAWGSRTAIASLQRRHVPSAGPEAELWMGAHPSDPSLLSDEPGALTLPDFIARDPVGMLGRAVVDRFGGRLPYLLKILAAVRPLSLQVHPNADQARAGFAADEALGLAQEGSARNYVDPFHKPELLVAVDEFEVLCGFRDPGQTADLLESLGVAALGPVIAALRTGSVTGRLRVAMQMLLTWPAVARAGLVAAVTDAGHPLAATLGRLYPGDIGVVVALLLNHVRLRPDEAVFMPAGNLHTYLGGLGVEVMAASDNVLRCGLTAKHVDSVELMRVLRYEVLTEPVVRPVPVAPGMLTWATPAREFALVKAAADAASGPVSLPGTGPRIITCLRGEARLRTAAQARTLRSGDSVFVAATEPPVEVDGQNAVVFQAAPR